MQGSRKLVNQKKKTLKKTLKKRKSTGLCKKCGCNCRVKCTCGKKCKDHCHRNRLISHKGGFLDPLGLHAYPYGGPYINNPHMAVVSKQMGGQGEASGHFAYTGMKGGQPISIDLNTNRGLSGGGGVPFPLVGTPWSSSPSSWPGVTGPHNGVTFPLNSYDSQPDTENIIDERSNQYPTEYGTVLMGGSRRKKKNTRKARRKLKGGTAGSGVSGWVSQIGNKLSDSYYTWKGEQPYPSVMPYEDQFSGNKF